MSEEAIEVQEETKILRRTKTKPEKPEGFPIKLKRNYRPAGEFKVEEGGEVRDPGIDSEGREERDKMMAGAVIWVPVDEARRAVSLGIAERNDPFV